MEQLRQTYTRGGVRATLACMTMLGMHIVLPSVFCADLSAHIPAAEAIVADAITKWPDSGLLLWMVGRMHRLKRDVPLAVRTFQRSAASVADAAWVQLQHLCDYEMGWAYCFAMHWAACIPHFARCERAGRCAAFVAHPTPTPSPQPARREHMVKGFLCVHAGGV